MSCCAACGRQIDFERTNFNLPPWCPGCGADLKLVEKKRPGMWTPPRAEELAAPEPCDPHLAEAVALAPRARRPKPAAEPREELPMMDGYMLTGAETEQREQMARLRSDVWGFGAAGALFLALTLWGIIAAVEKLGSWKRAAGVVSDMSTSVSRRGRVSSLPVFTYSVNGKTYKAGRWWDLNLSSYSLGDRVEVFYNPADPSESMVRSFDNLWGWPIAAALVAGFCLLVAASSWYLRRFEARAAATA
jgi:hypothetical protein